jgi:anti-sigma-K factor RskA
LNIEEYISSGVLEAYVLGELTLPEREEVEKNLLRFPELKRELTLIEETQEKILMAAGAQPPTGLKSKIFEQIEASGTQARVLTTESESISMWRFAAAASILIAIVSSYLAYTYWGRWKSTSSELTALVNENKRIAEDYNQVNQQMDKLSRDVKVIDDSQFTRVVMTGTVNAPGALASVYWNKSSKEVYLRIQNMKDLAQENQYQLWAIIDGKPVDAGIFDGGIDGLIKMKDIGQGATTFAVTIEPRGGRPSPALETMQVAGNVAKS